MNFFCQVFEKTALVKTFTISKVSQNEIITDLLCPCLAADGTDALSRWIWRPLVVLPLQAGLLCCWKGPNQWYYWCHTKRLVLAQWTGSINLIIISSCRWNSKHFCAFLTDRICYVLLIGKGSNTTTVFDGIWVVLNSTSVSVTLIIIEIILAETNWYLMYRCLCKQKYINKTTAITTFLLKYYL